RPEAQSFRGAHYRFAIDEELSEGLRGLARREGVTLFMALLASWQALLHHYTGEQRLNVGTPVAGRNRVEIEPLIGFFINTLVLSGELGGDPSYAELLRRVRETCLEAYAHQDVPFERLVEALQPERSLDRSPLFQVWFALMDSPLDKLQLDGLRVEEFAFDSLIAKYDLALLVTDSEPELGVVLEYNSDLFEPATAARMAWHLVTLLRHAVAEPGLRLSQLGGILKEEERKRRSAKAQEFKAADRQKLKGIKRRVISG
ncbi:MAG: condensation domain-containing protein, partial [Pyrinomonadaceae bacterium]